MNIKILLGGVVCLLVFLAYPVAADANDTFSVVATPPLIVFTNDSTNVEETTATLNGFLLSGGSLVCQYRFEYDIDSGVPYASSTSWTGAITTGDEFSQDVTGLTKGELYFFRAQCRNVNGAGSGDEKRFLTKSDEPSFFNALGQTRKIRLTWTKGDGADLTVVVRKQGEYPADMSDGTVVYNDTGGMYDDAVSVDIYYYYRAWSYCSEGGLYQYSDSYGEDSAKASAPVPPVPPPVLPPPPPAVEEVAVIPWWMILGASTVVLGGVFAVITVKRGWFPILLAKRRKREGKTDT